MSRQRTFLYLSTAFLCYLCIYLLLNHYTIHMLMNGYVSGVRGDPAIYIWATHHNIQSFLTNPLKIFETSTFYPYGLALAYSDNYILPSCISLLVTFFTTNFPLAYNIPLLIAAALNGISMFALAEAVTIKKPASLIAGLCFMLLPYFAFHDGHPQLQYAFFLPLMTLFTLKFLEKQSFLYASLIGACITLCFLCSVYYAMYCYLLSAVLLFTYALQHWRTLSLRMGTVLIVANIPWLIATEMIATPYLETRLAFGPQHISLAKNYSASLFSYLSAAPHKYTWGPLTAHFTHLESYLFVGGIMLSLGISRVLLLLIKPNGGASDTFLGRSIVTVIVLAFLIPLIFAPALYTERLLRRWTISIPLWIILGLLSGMLIRQGLHKRKTDLFSPYEKRLSLLFALFFFLFASLGIIGTHSEHVWHPELYYHLYHLLPGFNAMRATCRIGIITDFILILFASDLMALLITKTANITPKALRKVSPAVLYTTAAVLLMVELQTAHAHMTPEPPRPKIYEALKNLPNHHPAISLPFFSPLHDNLRFVRAQTDYIRWHQGDNRPIVNGFSGKIPILQQTLGDTFNSFPRKRALDALSQIVDLRYIILPRKYWKASKKKLLERIHRHLDRLDILKVEKDGLLIELKPLLNISALESPCLYLPPSKTPQKLSFDLKLKNTDLKISLRVFMDTGAHISVENRNKTHDNRYVIELDVNSSDWTTWSVTVPPGMTRVKAHQVKFNLKDIPPPIEVWLRNPRIVTRES